MRILFFFQLFFVWYLEAQNKYPEGYFSQPLDIPLVLSGTFGELRSNHFHSGVDIKTNGKENLSVYGVASGYVSRIKIQRYGYGKALYITHPNGYTSVYCHLNSFASHIASYVKEAQYKDQTYEIELFPEKNTLAINQGDFIAYSGNTGGSGGPHLHFEIRDSLSNPINPLLFGYEVKDTKSPTVQGVYVYPIDKDAIVKNSNERVKLVLRKVKENLYIANSIEAIGVIGLGIDTFDQLDMAYNKNGVFKVRTLINGNLNFEYDFETFSFAETRDINTFIDYPKYVTTRKRIQKCYVEPYNNLSLYNKKNNNGLIVIEEGNSYQIEIEVLDIADNKTKVIIPIEGYSPHDKIVFPQLAEEGTLLIAGRDNIFKQDNATVFVPANTFYYDFMLDFKTYGDTVMVHNFQTPIKNKYTLTIDLPEERYLSDDRLFIAYVKQHNKLEYQQTFYQENALSTRTNYLGEFIIVKDSIAPQVKSLNFKEGQNLKNYKTLKLLVSDDLSGIDSYNATLNGEWILMEYEYKKDMLIYNFSDLELKEGKYDLEVEVKDKVGNTIIYKTVFYR